MFLWGISKAVQQVARVLPHNQAVAILSITGENVALVIAAICQFVETSYSVPTLQADDGMCEIHLINRPG
jgi:hypothetical protein